MNTRRLRPQFLVAFVLVLLSLAAWRFWDWRSHHLRFDGAYYHLYETLPLTGSFLRFYPDQRAVECACAGSSPAEIAEHVSYAQDFQSRGTYHISGGRIQIALRSESGRDYFYSGEVYRGYIDFNTWGRHEFIKVSFKE